MPLTGKVAADIRELHAANKHKAKKRSHKQIVAIAISEARKKRYNV